MFEYVNVFMFNSLAATGLTVLYYVFHDIFRNRRKDTADFFKYISIGWLLNLIYLGYIGLQDSHPLFPLPQGRAIEYALCAVSDTFFLLGVGKRFAKNTSLLSNKNIIIFASAILTAFMIEALSGIEDMPVSTWISILYDAGSIGLIAISFFDFFRKTYVPVDRTAKRALVLSMFLYSILQFGYFVELMSIEPGTKILLTRTFFIAGMAFKLLHIYGLSRFSQFFFEDYDEKRRAFNDAKTRSSLFDKLAHELNTPALELRLRIQQMLDQFKFRDGYSLSKNEAEKIAGLIERMQSLMNSFQEFRIDIPLQKGGEKHVNVNTVCDMCILSLKLTTGLRVKIRTAYGHQPTVIVSRNELYQIIQNVLKNAMEASVLAKVENPLVEISTSIQNAKDNEKDVVLISISDNGGGVKAQNFSRIFEDGFTTKRPNRGRGHGLWIAKALLEKWNGKISVQNVGDEVTGIGARFEISIPYYPIRT